VSLEFILPTRNCLWHVDASNRFLLQSISSDLVNSTDTLEPRFWILRDYDGTVTIAVVAASFLTLLVKTPLDPMLAVVGP